MSVLKKLHSTIVLEHEETRYYQPGLRVLQNLPDLSTKLGNRTSGP